MTIRLMEIIKAPLGPCKLKPNLDARDVTRRVIRSQLRQPEQGIAKANEALMEQTIRRA